MHSKRHPRSKTSTSHPTTQNTYRKKALELSKAGIHTLQTTIARNKDFVDDFQRVSKKVTDPKHQLEDMSPEELDQLDRERSLKRKLVYRQTAQQVQQSLPEVIPLKKLPHAHEGKR